jgi:carbonic anhydrase
LVERKLPKLEVAGSKPVRRLDEPADNTSLASMPHADELLVNARARRSELAMPGMDPRPRMRMAVLTCMDVRVDIYTMLGLQRGDAHIIRNAGGLVTDDAVRSLSASQRLLGTREVLVIMHECCGLQGASEEEFEQQLAADGAQPSWRLGAFEDLEATLRASVVRLREAPELTVRDAIRGFVFDPDSGLLREAA